MECVKITRTGSNKFLGDFDPIGWTIDQNLLFRIVGKNGQVQTYKNAIDLGLDQA